LKHYKNKIKNKKYLKKGELNKLKLKERLLLEFG
jgi:hypothetical protein